MTAAPDEIRRLVRAYGNPQLNLKEYGYLSGSHPLELWCVGELLREPAASWNDLWERSQGAREIASSWLYQNRYRQELHQRQNRTHQGFAGDRRPDECPHGDR